MSNTEMCCHTDNEEPNDSEHTICTDGCCSTESLNITLDTDFTLESVDIPNSELILPSKRIYIPFIVDTETLAQDAPTRGSPSSPPLFLLYSSFIFYG